MKKRNFRGEVSRCLIGDLEDMLSGIQVPCKVNRGRKFRGEGMIVGFRRKVSRYGEQRYVKIYADGAIHEAVEDNVDIDIDALQSLYLIWRAEQVSKIDIEALSTKGSLKENITFALKGFKLGTDEFFRTFTNYVVDVTGLKSQEELKEEQRAHEFKIQKMEELRAWAATKVKPEEVEELAQRVWNKRYATA